jgi:Amidase
VLATERTSRPHLQFGVRCRRSHHVIDPRIVRNGVAGSYQHQADQRAVWCRDIEPVGGSRCQQQSCGSPYVAHTLRWYLWQRPTKRLIENAAQTRRAEQSDPDYITGGSSGGSSTAITANIVYATLGTDAGGSVRIPAALCGHVGLKQTHGLVSNRGSVFNTWSGDHVGPHTKTVADAELMLRVMAVHDPLDSTSVDHRLGPMPS